MSVKVHFIGGETAFYPKGKTVEPSHVDPATAYDVRDADGGVLALIPRQHILRADILPDEG